MSHFDPETLHEMLVSRISMLRQYVSKKVPARFQSTISADDIVQETLMAAYRAAPTFVDDRPRAVDRWLVTIAGSKLIDSLRAARAAKRGGDRRACNAKSRMTSLCDLVQRVRSPQKTPSSEAARIEAAHVVGISLHELRKPYREAIELRFMQGLSQEEVAHRLGRTPAAVNSLLYRGLCRLRASLGEAGKYLSGAESRESLV
jgi:RNA polymerase sigma-70 factor (ECF subfamily)